MMITMTMVMIVMAVVMVMVMMTTTTKSWLPLLSAVAFYMSDGNAVVVVAVFIFVVVVIVFTKSILGRSQTSISFQYWTETNYSRSISWPAQNFPIRLWSAYNKECHPLHPEQVPVSFLHCFKREKLFKFSATSYLCSSRCKNRSPQGASRNVTS